MKRIICPKHSKKNTLCLQIYLKINQARVQDEKQLGDKLQCVCYIVGNSFMYSGVRRALSTRWAQLLEKQAQRIISAR